MPRPLDMCAHAADAGSDRGAPGDTVVGDGERREETDADVVAVALALVEALVDDPQGPRNALRIGTDAETDPVRHGGGERDGLGPAADHLDRDGFVDEVIRPFEATGSFAHGDVAAVQIGAQHPDVARQLIVALGARGRPPRPRSRRSRCRTRRGHH